MAKIVVKGVVRRAGRQTLQPAFDFDVDTPSDVICGVDEAGRGPLAGPVVAAAGSVAAAQRFSCDPHAPPCRPGPGCRTSKTTFQTRRSGT